MKIAIKSVGRRKRELWIDDKLAAAGWNLDEIEQQVRIIKMMQEIDQAAGKVKATL